jgi:dTDP-4-amino-4,6-dideoxygalactose transaminase
MDTIMDVARSHGVLVVEDCAQSHGTKWRGRLTGTFGDVGCFSFFPTKNVGAFGDAGAIVTDDEEIAEKVRMFRNYGSKKKYYNDVIGVNSRLDEMQAALLMVRLKYVDEILKKRSAIAETYLEDIKNGNIRLPEIREGSNHTWHIFVIECENREGLRAYLAENGIHTQIHYPVPPYLSEAYAYMGFPRDSFPESTRQADRVLSLPLYYGMAREDVEYVISKLNDWSA